MRKRLKTFGLILLLCLAVLIAGFFSLRSKYRLVIRDLAQTSVKNATSDLANDAVAKQIEMETFSMTGLFTLKRM